MGFSGCGRTEAYLLFARGQDCRLQRPVLVISCQAVCSISQFGFLTHIHIVFIPAEIGLFLIVWGSAKWSASVAASRIGNETRTRAKTMYEPDFERAEVLVDILPANCQPMSSFSQRRHRFIPDNFVGRHDGRMRVRQRRRDLLCLSQEDAGPTVSLRKINLLPGTRRYR